MNDIIDELLKKNTVKDNYHCVNLTFYKIRPELLILEKQVIIDELDKLDSSGFSFANLRIEDICSFLKYIFPDCKIIDCQGVYNGHPDFIVEKGDLKIYIEIKIGKDSLHISQLNWMVSNTDKIIYVLNIEEDSIEHVYNRTTNYSSNTFKPKSLLELYPKKNILEKNNNCLINLDE